MARNQNKGRWNRTKSKMKTNYLCNDWKTGDVYSGENRVKKIEMPLNMERQSCGKEERQTLSQ